MEFFFFWLITCCLWTVRNHFDYLITIPKTIGNRKRGCARGCSRWQTLPERICRSQSTNQFSERNKRLPDLCFEICRFSQVAFITSNNLAHKFAAQSPFLFQIVLVIIFLVFQIVFGNNLISFSMGRRTLQRYIRKVWTHRQLQVTMMTSLPSVSLSLSLSLTPNTPHVQYTKCFRACILIKK